MNVETQSALGQSLSTVYEPPATSYNLHELFEYRNRDKVDLYLQSHPELSSFLEESHGYLVKHFGAAAKLALEVVRDPEAEQQQLFVYIKTAAPTDEALKRLGRFDEEWFLNHLDRVGDHLNFNLEVI